MVMPMRRRRTLPLAADAPASRGNGTRAPCLWPSDERRTRATVPGPGGSFLGRRRTETRPSTPSNVASLHRMRDVNGDTHQSRWSLRRVLWMLADGLASAGYVSYGEPRMRWKGPDATLGSPDRGG